MNDRMPQHAFRERIYGVLTFVGVIWLVFFIERVSPYQLESLGVTPRTFDGLVGIVAAPFLHANLEHLVSNTIPLIVLLLLLTGAKAQTWPVVAAIVLLSGGLLWLFGRNATHIGASCLIYGLISYLLVSGLREGRVISLIAALVVGFLYGGTLFAGVLPSSVPQISWEGHLFGAIAGGVVAFAQTAERNKQETPVNPAA